MLLPTVPHQHGGDFSAGRAPGGVEDTAALAAHDALCHCPRQGRSGVGAGLIAVFECGQAAICGRVSGVAPENGSQFLPGDGGVGIEGRVRFSRHDIVLIRPQDGLAVIGFGIHVLEGVVAQRVSGRTL